MKKYIILDYDGKQENFVYKLYFESSNKVYIGITNNPKRRVAQHYHSWNHKKSASYYSSKWIHKHTELGNTLIMEVLTTLPTYEEAKLKEIELIAHYRSLGNNVINILDGGDGAPGRSVSQDTREKIANSLRGKTHTEERRKNISEGHKDQIPWNKGKEVLPHVLEAMLEGQRKRSPEKTQELYDHYRDRYSKEYKIVDPQGNVLEIKNLKKFCQDNNLSYSSMNKVVNAKLDTHRGYSSIN